MVEPELYTGYHSQSFVELALAILVLCGLRSTGLVCQLYGMASMLCKERNVSSEYCYICVLNGADSKLVCFSMPYSRA